ncbi:MAG: hypothetical protein HZA88_24115 [Verrucomicrobia bacterium]|nr:hypothetical protein [Verrucomicrobiota bacterium]
MVCLLLAAALNVSFTVTNDTAVSRRHALVAAELPVPAGAASDPKQVRIVGYDQLSVAAQISAIAKWPDGSLKSVLALFTCDLDPTETKTWSLIPGRSTTRQRDEAHMTTEDGIVMLNTGKMCYRVGDHLGALTLDPAAGESFVVAPPERDVVEENGPVRAVIRHEGWLTRGSEKPFRYTRHYAVIAGQPAVRVTTRIETAANSDGAQIKCAWVPVRPAAQHRKAIVLATAGSTSTLAPGDARRLEQPVVAEARLLSDRQHPGWLDFRGDASGMLFAVKLFWQRAPKALEIKPDGTARYEIHSAAAPPLRLTAGAPLTDEFILAFHADGESFDNALVEMNQPLKAVIKPPVAKP